MKVLACLDEDGHFAVSPIVDRAKCIKLLLMNKDYFLETLEESGYSKTYHFDAIFYYTEDEWLKFLRSFEQRGMYEITEL